MKYLLMFVTLLVGALMPLQAILNSKLGKQIGGPLMGSMISFVVGLTFLLFLNLASNYQAVGQLRHSTATPWWVWTGGVLGAIFVGYITWVNQKQGIALTFSLVVSGQLLISLFIDHYGLFGSAVRTITLEKILGVALIIGGMLLIKK
ncbi:MAG: DMT family transporter [Chitinophagaceae bacterium]|nr:MAG: DMT family transporter [Chitinophagaceae bacterium]